MTQSAGELWDSLYRSHELPFGRARTGLVEQVLARAEEIGDDELAFAARMAATEAYHFGGEPARGFVTFSRCLSEFDQDPRPYHQRYAHTLLWQFKWIVTAMTDYPEIPLERTRQVLDDMERRYRAGGHSLHAVLACRHQIARHVGDMEAAAHYYEQWCAAPRDSLSDCEACEPTARIRYLTLLGRDEEAVALAEPVLRGELNCVTQPQSILTALMVPYVRTGRLDEAVSAHRRAYRAIRNSRGDMSRIADHLELCARTGNEARGLELLERHLGWLDEPPSPLTAMWFAASAALLLRRLVDAGRGDLVVRRPGGGTAAAALAEEMTRLATDLAARFDERNGTSYQSGRVTAQIQAEPLIDYLPLSPSRPTSPARVGGAATAAADAGTPTGPAVPRPAAAGPVVPAPTVPPDAGPMDVLRMAEERAMADDTAGAIALLKVFDERFAAESLDARARAWRRDWQAMELLDADDLPRAREVLQQAVEELTAVGEETQAYAARSRLGSVLTMLGEQEEGLRLLRESLAYMRTDGPPLRRATAALRLSEALARGDQLEEALTYADEAVGHAEQAGQPNLVAQTLLHRAQVLEALDRPEAVKAVADARERYRPLPGDGFAVASVTLAGLLEDPGQRLRVVEEALARPVAGEVRVGLLHARAVALMDAGRGEEGVRAFIDAVAEAEVVADPGDPVPALLRVDLTRAYLAIDRPEEAAETGEEALPALVAGGDEQIGARDQCRELLGHAYRMLGETDLVLEQVDELLASYTGYDHAADRGRLHELAGEALWEVDRDAEAAERFTAAAAQYVTAGLPVDEVRARRRAVMARHHAREFVDDPDAGLAVLAETDARAAQVVAQRPDDPEARWEQAILDHEGALVLAGAGRWEEAVERLERAARQLRKIDAYLEALLSDSLRGELLLHAGYPDASAAVLRDVVTSLPSDHPRLPFTAALLVRALQLIGKKREAAKVQARYGISDEDVEALFDGE